MSSERSRGGVVNKRRLKLRVGDQPIDWTHGERDEGRGILEIRGIKNILQVK